MRVKCLALAVVLLLGAAEARAAVVPTSYGFTGSCVNAANGNPIAGLMVDVTFIFPDGHGGTNNWTTICFTDNAGNWACDYDTVNYGGRNTAVTAFVVAGQNWKCATFATAVGFGPGTVAIPAFHCVPNP